MKRGGAHGRKCLRPDQGSAHAHGVDPPRNEGIGLHRGAEGDDAKIGERAVEGLGVQEDKKDRIAEVRAP